MALVITDKAGNDVREIEGVTFDFAYGSDENEWELTIDAASDIRLEPRARIYLEGTDYVGIYDGRKVDTEEQEITYSGRTWTGVLATRFLVPDRGSDYITYNCDANRLIELVITRLGLGSLFKVSPGDSGIRVSGRFDRYIDGYSGLCKALNAAGAKLIALYDGEYIDLWAAPVVSYTGDRALDADEIALKIEQTRGCVNHLICAGKGELKDRIELHLYADRKHNISKSQTLFGIDEIAEFYDYSNADATELLERGVERLLKLQEDGERVELAIQSDRLLDIGDIVEGLDPETGAAVTARVSKKIVTIDGSKPEVEYKAVTSATVGVL